MRNEGQCQGTVGRLGCEIQGVARHCVGVFDVGIQQKPSTRSTDFDTDAIGDVSSHGHLQNDVAATGRGGVWDGQAHRRVAHGPHHLLFRHEPTKGRWVVDIVCSCQRHGPRRLIRG